MSGMQIGGIFLLIYSAVVVAIGVFKPGIMWKIVKMKTGRNRSDKFTEYFLYIFAGLCAVIAVLMLTIWA